MAYIKKVRCRVCGGAKATPPRTAYVYCDYCATLADYDIQLAMEAQTPPGPAYESLQVALTPRIEEATLKNDRDALFELQRELIEKHIELCPKSYSPRIGDPRYRDAVLEYQATIATYAAFNEEGKRLEADMNHAIRTLRWLGNPMQGVKVRPDTFWDLYNAYRDMTESNMDLVETEGLLERHPDDLTRELALRLGRSAFVQGWLPYLDEATANELLDATGLRAVYDHVPDPKTVRRNCGQCGHGLETVEGAERVLCEACGFVANTAAPDIDCRGCGAPVSVPEGTRMYSCPYCQAELRLA